jgi:adenosylcobinamide kinase/adenosylcobinamide-phosphate guanylyltransferase
MPNHLTLITGGARSGKTRFALDAPEQWSPRTYIATAELFDEEMRQRAARHRAERGSNWSTLEEPFEVAARIQELKGLVVVDCLTIWLSNWMLRDETRVQAQIDALCSALRNSPCEIRAITNEVGLSVVPDNALARRFRDWSGLMNQRVAAAADAVYFMVCGIATRVK